MNKHMSPHHIQSLDECISACQDSIDGCQGLIDMCSMSNAEECSAKVGILIALSTKTIQACHSCIRESEDHTKTCAIDRCKEASLNCIAACTDSILESQNILKECALGNQECISSCVKSIALYSRCAELCQASQDIGKSF